MVGKMTEKRFYLNEGEVGILKMLDLKEDNEAIYHTASKSDMKMVVELFNRLSEENEQLKRQIGNLEHTRDFCADVLADFERIEKENQEIKNDEKQLSIDFLGYKMKLRKVLQRGYDKAKGQTLYAEVFLEISREMGVDLE